MVSYTVHMGYTDEILLYVHCIQYTIHWGYTDEILLYTVYSTQYTGAAQLKYYYTLYTVHNTLELHSWNTIHCIQYTIHWGYTEEILDTVYSIYNTHGLHRWNTVTLFPMHHKKFLHSYITITEMVGIDHKEK